MSELKAWTAQEIANTEKNFSMPPIKVYFKHEADRYIDELKDEINSLKVQFREFNDKICKKVVEASRTMSAISQDAQMDFYEEFIKEQRYGQRLL